MERERDRKREALEARIMAMRKEFEIEDEESQRVTGEELARESNSRKRQGVENE
jgi:hypothetical protein